MKLRVGDVVKMYSNFQKKIIYGLVFGAFLTEKPLTPMKRVRVIWDDNHSSSESYESPRIYVVPPDEVSVELLFKLIEFLQMRGEMR